MRLCGIKNCIFFFSGLCLGLAIATFSAHLTMTQKDDDDDSTREALMQQPLSAVQKCVKDSFNDKKKELAPKHHQDVHVHHQNIDEHITYPINFLHIPKTGGTTIEKLSKRNSHSCGVWGSRLIGIDGMKEEHPWAEGYWQHTGIYKKRECVCAEWHMPPSVFQNDTLMHILFPATDTFCIMREPLQKLISFYQHNFKGPSPIRIDDRREIKYFRGPCFDDSAEEMNKHLEKILTEALDDPCIRGCHLLPQTAFMQTSENLNNDVAAYDNTDQTQARNCKHVLLLEDDQLEIKFNQLMNKVNCPIQYDKTIHTNKIDKWCLADPELYLPGRDRLRDKYFRPLKVQDLSPRVIELAEQIYKEDIELYAKLAGKKKRR